MKLRDSERVRPALRYVVVAVVAFFMGTGAIVSAAPLGPIMRLMDGANAANLAAVDASGNVSVKVTNLPGATTDFPDAGSHSRLDTANGSLANIDGDMDTSNSSLSSIEGKTDNLTFDGSSNLKVSVENQPAAAPNADSAREVFQKNTVITFADGAGCVGGFGQFSVPAGKRLVIEYVSVHERNPGDRLVEAGIFTKAGGNSGITHFIELKDNGDWFFVGNDSVRLYADAGPNVSFSACFEGTSGSRNVAFQITGYLVPLP
jgi:hypothetical protein